MVDKDRETDLPQPGLDESENGSESDRANPTEGPGSVTVDEPTKPALDPNENGFDDDESRSD